MNTNEKNKIDLLKTKISKNILHFTNLAKNYEYKEKELRKKANNVQNIICSYIEEQRIEIKRLDDEINEIVRNMNMLKIKGSNITNYISLYDTKYNLKKMKRDTIAETNDMKNKYDVIIQNISQKADDYRMRYQDCQFLITEKRAELEEFDALCVDNSDSFERHTE